MALESRTLGDHLEGFKRGAWNVAKGAAIIGATAYAALHLLPGILFPSAAAEGCAALPGIDAITDTTRLSLAGAV